MVKISHCRFVSKRKKGSVEKCVYCQCNTWVPVDTPIEKRMYYLPGAGQLCRSCWEILYKKS